MILSKKYPANWPWIMLAVICAGLAAATWLLGPRLIIGNHAVLRAAEPRMFVMLVIMLLGTIAVLALRLRGVTRQPAATSEASGHVETSDNHRQSVARAMHQLSRILRRMKAAGWHDRSHPYLLPWYLVLGPVGAGKTSLIQASGLRCDAIDQWDTNVPAGPATMLSLTDRAVFVDTDGALGNQMDRREWRYFLTRIKRFRRCDPASGVILTLSLPDFQATAQTELGRDLRQQLHDISVQLGARLPIYVVFTKLDALPGFHSFFNNPNLFPSSNVLGITLPLPHSNGESTRREDIASLLRHSFDELVQWQIPRTLERVHDSSDAANRFDAFMFLPELAALKTRLAEFAHDVFEPGRFEEPLLLRGIYFTSARPDATKPDTPQQEAGSDTSSGIPKAMSGMFICDLIDKVILPEAGLAGLNASSRRTVQSMRIGGLVAVVTISAALVTWWSASFLGNIRLIDEVRAAAIQARTALTALANAPGSRRGQGSDLAATLPALHSLAALPTGRNAGNIGVPLMMQAGLSQYVPLSVATRAAYGTGLRQIFLPRITSLITRQINEQMGQPNALYSALMVYLMFGGAHEIDHELVTGWMKQRCAQLYPGAAQVQICSDLQSQLHNLLQMGFDPIPLDQPLVAHAREALGTLTPALRGMELLKSDNEISILPPWRFRHVTGPRAEFALVRRSGRPMHVTVPGLYTASAFSSRVLPKIAEIAGRVIRDDWVRYTATGQRRVPLLVRRLEREMVDIYVSEYVSQWDDVLNDLDFAPFASFQAEFSVLQALFGPASPYAALLRSIAQNTALARPRLAAANQTPDGVKLEVTQPDDGGPSAARAITRHFAMLHDFVSGKPSPLDELIRQANQLHGLIGPVASNAGDASTLAKEMAAAPSFAQTLAELQQTVVSAPPAVAAPVVALVRQTSALAYASTRSNLNAEWKAQVLPFCQLAINGHYPFTNASNEATMADFTRMFAPEGLLGQFFERQLKPFVDTSAKPWKLRTNEGGRPAITPQALRTFEQAAQIRSVFFPTGATKPLVSFALSPVELDPGAMRVTLDIEGTLLTYQYGPQQAVSMQWPGATTSGVSLSFGAREPGQPAFVSIKGPWSLFRFLNAQPLQPKDGTNFSFTVHLGSRFATFALQAATADNPFRQNLFNGFRCPSSLAAGP